MSTPVQDQDGAASRDDLLLRVSERYHFGHRSHIDIGKEFGISRFRVARLLDEAERRGVVQITLHRPPPQHGGLAAELKAKYGLRQAAVVDSGAMSEQQLRDALGREGAVILHKLLADGDVLGVGWGRAVEAVANFAPALPRCQVVQLSGITGHPSSNSMELVRRFAGLTGEDAYPLYAPLIVPSAETAASLRLSDGIAETFTQFRNVSVALVAIGSWNPPNSQLHSVVGPKVREMLTSAGLQAEIGGIFLDADGDEIDTPLSNQIMSISSSDFRAIPTVIAVAGTVSKARSIRAVLNGGYVNALVTDSSAARRLLD